MSDPIVLSQLRHAYEQLVNGHVRDQRAFADGMIAPLIRRLEADPTTDEALVVRLALAGAKATGCGLTLDSGELVLCNDARLPPDRNAGGCVCREVIVAAIRAMEEKP